MCHNHSHLKVEFAGSVRLDQLHARIMVCAQPTSLELSSGERLILPQHTVFLLPYSTVATWQALDSLATAGRVTYFSFMMQSERTTTPLTQSPLPDTSLNVTNGGIVAWPIGGEETEDDLPF